MDWLRINKDLPRHPKAKALARRLGERVSWWRIAQVWAWAVDYAKDGVVRGPDAELDVEEAAGWEGDAGRFIEAAITTGFLERVDGGLSIHDWMEHNGKALAAAAAEAERKRKMRRPADVHDVSGGRPPDEMPTSSVDETRRRRDEKLSASQAPADAARPPPLELEAQPAEKPQPPKPKKPRQPSRQEALWERLQAMRAEALPGAVPDPGLKPALLNQSLGDAIAQLSEPGVERAYAAFLADTRWARTLDPPCPLRAFVGAEQLAKYASAAQRMAPAAPPAERPKCERCFNAAEVSEQDGHRLCFRCRQGWFEKCDGQPYKAPAGALDAWIDEWRRACGAPPLAASPSGSDGRAA